MSFEAANWEMVRRIERWSGSVAVAAVLSGFAEQYASLLEMDVRFPEI